MIHEATATTSPQFINHIKEEEEEGGGEVEEDPMYDITESQYGDNVIQHLEIVPVDTEIDKKE